MAAELENINQAHEASFDASRVKALVFDLGNVILDLDMSIYDGSWPRTELGDHHALEKQLAGKSLWYEYECGHVSTEDFLETLQMRTQRPKRQIIDYWNSLLSPGIHPQRYLTLARMKERYPLYVLSNTNDLHVQWVRNHVAEAGFADFESRFFRQVFFSFEMGTVKPEADIYRIAAESIFEDIGVGPEGLFFIDDRPENVLEARAQGWQALELTPGRPVEELLALLDR